MERFYSQATGCTYLSGLNTVMPNDVVLITEDHFLAVIGNPEAGKVRSHNAQGLPILVDPPPLTEQELAAAARAWRNQQLTASQWLVDRDRDEQAAGAPMSLSTDRYHELLDYRQDLRDWPASVGFPAGTSRPMSPVWLSATIDGT